MRANSGLKAQEYSGPILGLIFLRFAEARFTAQRVKLEAAGASMRRGSRVDDPDAYHAEGVLYLSPEARYDMLLALPEPLEGSRARWLWHLAVCAPTAQGRLRSSQRACDGEVAITHEQLRAHVVGLPWHRVGEQATIHVI